MPVGSYVQVTVQSSSPTLVIAANNSRRGITIFNNGSVNVWFGPDANITTGTAPILVNPQNYYQFQGDMTYRGVFYGLAVSATADIRIWEWTN